MPVAENILLRELGKDDRRLFHEDKLMETIEEWKSNSKIIISKYGDRFTLKSVRDMGFYRN